MSFKKKRIPHELILRESEWEQPYEKNRWLLWSIAALICAGVLSVIVVLSLLPDMTEESGGATIVVPIDNRSDASSNYGSNRRPDTN